MATFTEWSLGNSPSLGYVLKKNRPEKFPLITTNNRFALAVQWSVKNIFAPKFPDIPEKLWRRRRWRKPTNAQCFAFQANAINCISTCYFKATWNRKPARKSKKALINSSPIKQRSPLDTERKLNVHKMFRRLQGIF